MRKAYLKLSLVIHPDRLRGFDDATRYGGEHISLPFIKIPQRKEKKDIDGWIQEHLLSSPSGFPTPYPNQPVGFSSPSSNQSVLFQRYSAHPFSFSEITPTSFSDDPRHEWCPDSHSRYATFVVASHRAFQALVDAFEHLSKPEMYEEVEEKKGAKKTKKLSRGNHGCHRTDIKCPRCKVKWSASPIDGNPEYFYNFMMTGLKTFNCSTCLFSFGCMYVTSHHASIVWMHVFFFGSTILSVLFLSFYLFCIRSATVCHEDGKVTPDPNPNANPNAFWNQVCLAQMPALQERL